MRHLSVPCKQTSFWIEELRKLGWLATTVPINKLNQFERAIPLSDKTPLVLPEPFADLAIIELDVLENKNTHYLDNLEDIIGKEIIDEFEAYWPKSYDHIGDLIIFKIKEEVKKYSEELGRAMILKNPNARIALLDNGVSGEYRIRKLTPLAIKNFDTSKIKTIDLTEMSEISTKTSVRENGYEIVVDPRKAYYSPRLSNERLGTLNAAKILSEKLGRPLQIADPYAGVGPSIVPLISEKNLVGGLYASDINPEAVKLLKENIEKHSKKRFNSNNEIGNFAKIEVVDARNLSARDDLTGKMDLLLVNIPHDSLQHIHHLFPLLSTNNSSLIRGWALVNDEKITTLESEISEQLDNFNEHITTKIIIEPLKSYSSTSTFVRFEIYFDIN